jgi:hypothetical protein
MPKIIREMLVIATSERHGKPIDSDATVSMERKKQEGYSYPVGPGLRHSETAHS